MAIGMIREAIAQTFHNFCIYSSMLSFKQLSLTFPLEKNVKLNLTTNEVY